MGHTVGKQAERAVQNSNRNPKLAALTPAEIIQTLRGNLRIGQVIPQHMIETLLERYDLVSANLAAARQEFIDATAEKSTLQQEHLRLLEEKQVMTDTIFGLTQNVQKLAADIEQFRAVYDAENRSETVKFERSES